MELLAVLLTLALLIGAVLGWVSLFRIRKLEQQVTALERTLVSTADQLKNIGVTTDRIDGHDVSAISPQATEQQEPEASASAAFKPAPITQNVWTGEPADDSEFPALEPVPASLATDHSISDGPKLLSRMRDQWMVWLGGLSVGLSGIFMVRYSIEQGLLGPLARVIFSILGGLLLHGVAEWGRRRSRQRFQALAALAGGASIILYSALLASLHLYKLFPPSLIFAALIIVSLCTMALAVLHGPVLAILGILGAYVIPVLVDTGSDNVLSLYVYSIIITAAALLLMRYVYRPWLWSGMLAGSLGWWLVTIDSNAALGLRGYYLAALLYLFLAMPGWDWLLRRPSLISSLPDPDEGLGKSTDSGILALTKINPFSLPKSLDNAPGLLSLVILILAFGFTITVEQTLSSALFQWTPFVAILLIASGNKPELLPLVAASLVVQLLAWLTLGLTTYDGVQLEGLIGPSQFEFIPYAGWMAFLYTSLSLRNLLTSSSRNFCCALAVASPLLWLSLCYLLVSDLSESIYWGAAAVGLGLFYLVLAGWRLKLDKQAQLSGTSRVEKEYFAVWLILAGHFAYSLAVAIMFREAGLTLALSAQILSIAWLIHRYDPPRLDLLLKLVLAVVVLRLTLNPWLLSYPADVHWSFWTYGGATMFAAVGAWRLRENEKLGKWLELAALHLFVLTLWAENRYYIYDGEIFRQQVDLLEFSINTALWSALALVYYLRHKVSQNLKPVYILASKILLCMGLGSYLMVLLYLNPFFTRESISATPVFNILLLSYGFPVVIGALLYKYYDRAFRKHLGAFVGLAAFAFINIEIRHLWSGTLSSASTMSNGELYTYTIVWLVLAITALLAGSLRFGNDVYRAGFGLMMLVIGKIFLFDMADLEGLLRVASFMGLGLSLLGLAYLYQRFNLAQGKASNSD